MKRMFLILMAAWGAATTVPASLILDEPFDYPDGVLTNAAAGVWLAHSAAAGSVEVVSGRAALAASNREDVHRVLDGGPYRDGVLYASFALNASALPGSAGNFFAHFNSSSFRARVFATTAGAAPGLYRVGVANGASSPSATVATDLAPGVDYRVVLRVTLNPVATTLWIDPESEAGAVARAEATDAATAVAFSAFALRQDTGIGALALDDLRVGLTFAEVVPGGSGATNPPVIGALADQSIPAGGSTPALAFEVSDLETPAGSLVVTVSSSNPVLVPNSPDHLVLGGSDALRTLSVVPASGVQGRATITVSVRDGDGNVASTQFEVVVGAPVIAPIPNQITVVGQPTSPASFLVGDAESPAAQLVLSSFSSVPSLLPEPGIALGGSGSNRTVTVTPAAGQSGLGYVTLTVSDGDNAAAATFAVSVNPFTGTDLEEQFSCGDGPLVLQASPAWEHAAGATNDLHVQDGRLALDEAGTEQVRAWLSGPAHEGYDAHSGCVIYASLTVQCIAPPAGAGACFAHLAGSDNGDSRARLAVSSQGAAPGACRLGIANGTPAPGVFHPRDVTPGETVTAVMRYTVGTAETVLWVNPGAESDTAVAATDMAVPVDIAAFGFQQPDGMGVLAIDDLRVGGAFAAVVSPPAARLQWRQVGSALEISWPVLPAGYVLQSTTTFPNGWSNHPDPGTTADGKTTVTVEPSHGSQLFRLAK
ncbi:MAG: hypothetical protein JXQ71_08345 [Verrucomicrobia bacterium]|nr:hypothetical protein [Verrucomicrobiota bacterium]